MKSAITAFLALTLVIAGCSSVSDGPVAIRTDSHIDPPCLLVGRSGVAVSDSEWGLAFRAPDDSGNAVTFGVYWPRGYSARRANGKIQLLDANGNVVAREGDTIAMGNPPLGGNVVYPCAPLEVTPG